MTKKSSSPPVSLVITPPPPALKNQVAAVLEATNKLAVRTKEDLEDAADVLHLVKQARNAILERKEVITRPMMAALSSVRELFKPLEVTLTTSEMTIKAKMLGFHAEEEARVQKEKERVVARVNKGTMKGETAIAKLEAIEDPSSAVPGKTQMRTLTKVRVVDVSLIPRIYLVPDLQKITEAILRQNIKIPGVETYEQKIIAAR